MEQQHKNLIQENYKTLVEDVMSIDYILRIFLNQELISGTLVEDYKKKTAVEKKRDIFRHIQNCGKNAFKALIQALRETNQNRLANLLDPNGNYDAPQTPGSNKVFKYGLKDIKVVPSVAFCDIKGLVPTYKSRSKNRGAALIVNNFNFDLTELDARQGSQYDVSNLKSLMAQLNITVELVEDRTGEDLEKAIKEFFNRKEQYDMIFAIIMSHGGQDGHGTFVYGSDGCRLYTSTIEHYATNVMSNHLYGIPKVILYNICRGNKIDLGINVAMPTTATESAQTLRVQSFSDLLIGHATQNDYVAHRDFEKGAWYISALVDALAQYAHAHHLEAILKMVYPTVALYRSDRYSMQSPTYTNIGFKDLYLNPGIYEEGGVLKRFGEVEGRGAEGGLVGEKGIGNGGGKGEEVQSTVCTNGISGGDTVES